MAVRKDKTEFCSLPLITYKGELSSANLIRSEQWQEIVISRLGVFYAVFRDAIVDNRIIILLAVIYYLIANIINLLLVGDVLRDLDFYYVLFGGFLLPFSLFYLCIATIYLLAKNSKIGGSWKIIKNAFFSKLSQFLVVFILIPPFVYSYSSLKQAIPFLYYFKYDIILVKIDYLIHLNNHPWELVNSLLGFPQFTLVIDRLYLLWGVIFYYSLLFMASYKNRFLKIQFFTTLALSWIIIGNIFAALLFSAGPCYYSGVTGSNIDPYSGLLQYLGSIDNIEVLTYHKFLWEAFQKGKFMPLGGISAMPSMHVAVAVLLAILYCKINRLLGILMVGYAFTIQVGSVHLGWHYAIDGYVSTLLVFSLWSLVGRFLKRKSLMV